mmetsp:Transcript_149559/g.363251  ORF Transcript_149559/g.363251 Transcript_149559/m.363251 type:complete len:236 (-) Transcript_149559:287-994(-)
MGANQPLHFITVDISSSCMLNIPQLVDGLRELECGGAPTVVFDPSNGWLSGVRGSKATIGSNLCNEKVICQLLLVEEGGNKLDVLGTSEGTRILGSRHVHSLCLLIDADATPRKVTIHEPGINLGQLRGHVCCCSTADSLLPTSTRRILAHILDSIFDAQGREELQDHGCLRSHHLKWHGEVLNSVVAWLHHDCINLYLVGLYGAALREDVHLLRVPFEHDLEVGAVLDLEQVST